MLFVNNKSYIGNALKRCTFILINEMNNIEPQLETKIPKLMNMSILASLGIHLGVPVFLQMIQLLLDFPAVTISNSIYVLVLFTLWIHCTCVRNTFLDKFATKACTNHI